MGRWMAPFLAALGHRGVDAGHRSPARAAGPGRPEERPADGGAYRARRHTLGALAAAIKARWVCEQAHQQLKEELGLDHFEGRSWLGLHHHALFTILAFTFLQHQRLRAMHGKKKEKNGRRGTATAADTPHDPRMLLATLSAPVRLRCPPAARMSRITRGRKESGEVVLAGMRMARRTRNPPSKRDRTTKRRWSRDTDRFVVDDCHASRDAFTGTFRHTGTAK
jgi:hypothetical protein